MVSYALSELTVSSAGIPAMFLPAAVGVGLLLRLPLRLWWWVVAVMLSVDIGAVTLLGVAAFPEAAIWGLSNAIQTVLLAALLRAARVDMTLPRHPLVLATLAAVVVGVVALAGSLTLEAVSAISAQQLWADWWGSDVLSVLLVVPVMLLLGRASLPRGRRAVEAGLWLVVAIVGLVVQFYGWFLPGFPVWLWLITGTPLLVLYSLRFGLLAMSGFLLVVDWIAVAVTAAGDGPFQQLTLGDGTPLRTLQMVLIVLAISVQSVSLLIDRSVRHGRTLAGQQALLDAVLEGSPVPTALMPADSAVLLRANHAFRELLGGEDLLTCFAEHERPGLIRLLTTPLPAGEVLSADFASTNRYGEPLLIRLRVSGVAADDFDRFGTLRTGVNVARIVHAEDMTEVRRRESMLRRDASTDPLTGLANRRHLRQVLEAALPQVAGDHLVSLAYIDLDGFKEVNDRYGHAAGDRVLRHVADCLRASISPQDVAARTGGDEFVVVSVGVPTPAVARARAEHLLKSLLNDPAVSSVVGASVGVAVTGDPRTTPDELLQRGDGLMYEAKACGGSCVVTDW